MKTRPHQLRRTNFRSNPFRILHSQHFQNARRRQDVPPVESQTVYNNAESRLQNVSNSPDILGALGKAMETSHWTTQASFPIEIGSFTRPAQIDHAVPTTLRPCAFHRRIVGMNEQDFHCLWTRLMLIPAYDSYASSMRSRELHQTQVAFEKRSDQSCSSCVSPSSKRQKLGFNICSSSRARD